MARGKSTRQQKLDRDRSHNGTEKDNYFCLVRHHPQSVFPSKEKELKETLLGNWMDFLTFVRKKWAQKKSPIEYELGK